MVQHRTLELGDTPIHIIDGLFEDDVVQSIFESLAAIGYRLDDYDTEETRHIPHWKAELDAESAHEIQAFDVIQKQVQSLYPDVRLEPGRVHSNLHMYGDQQNTHTDSSPYRGVTALYFANVVWEDRWMGEVLFYDGDEPLYAVAPRPGRLLSFHGHVHHRAGVPSRECFQPRITLAFKFRIA